MKKLLIILITLLITTSLTKETKADPLIGKKNFVGCWEKDDATVGNYTTLLANNSVSSLGFEWDYYLVEKEEFISIDRVTMGETVYLAVVWVTNCSTTWFQGLSMLRVKADGNDVYTTFKTLSTDSRYMCYDCCLSNVNVTINNNYNINDHVLWVHVKSGTMNVYWSGLGYFDYYQYKVYLPEEPRTSIVQQLGDNVYLIVAIALGFPVGLYLDSKTHKLLD